MYYRMGAVHVSYWQLLESTHIFVLRSPFVSHLDGLTLNLT